MAVEYTRSPEVQFPVANEESFAALTWLREHGASINVNPNKIAIAGDSAGANMATVVSCKYKKSSGGNKKSLMCIVTKKKLFTKMH
jgi:acetyl esterase